VWGHTPLHAPFFIALATVELNMAASDQQIADKARDSLSRILDADTTSWSEGERQQQVLEIDRLTNVITEFEAKAARSGGRRIFSPIKPVNR
jgi:hypothetical protein